MEDSATETRMQDGKTPVVTMNFELANEVSSALYDYFFVNNSTAGRSTGAQLRVVSSFGANQVEFWCSSNSRFPDISFA